jgi:hypothetical protein
MRRTSSTLIVSASIPAAGVVLGSAGVLGCEQADIATTALQTMTADLPAKAL